MGAMFFMIALIGLSCCLAAFEQGKIAGINYCRRLRNTLHPHTDPVTGETVWKPTPSGSEEKP